MKVFRVIAAKAIDHQTLIIKFENNELKKYDISPLLEKKLFSPLRNAAFFENFTLDPHGYGLVWNEDIDLSEYELWQNGISLDDETIIQDFESIKSLSSVP